MINRHCQINLNIIVTVIKIGTRKSRLALWQAEHVARLLKLNFPDVDVELVKITTSGDKFIDAPLSQAGGKGLFLKELEQALYDKRIDLAVHSMKDVTVSLPDGLHIGAILQRHDVRDALVSKNDMPLDKMKPGSVIGTCSLRRQCLVNHYYPHLKVENIRGNVDTRLSKLDAGEYDAIILAVAGLERLELGQRISQRLTEQEFIPAVGQGAVGIECRTDDERVSALNAKLNDQPTSICVTAERVVNEKLDGGCHMPIAVYAKLANNNLQMFAFVGLPDGSEIVSVTHKFNHQSFTDINPVLAGEQMADKLIARGAMKVIEQVNDRS